MASSRIFVRGLPPSITELDFKKHFGSQGTVTDARLFSQRRIGYVGYQSSEEAVKAVKYFNRSFIRMSKINVEIARSVEDSVPKQGSRSSEAHHGFASTQQADRTTPNTLKRKRETPGTEEKNLKLQEFLEVMKPQTKAGPTRAAEQSEVAPESKETAQTNVETEQDSDEEYQNIATKRRAKERKHVPDADVTPRTSQAITQPKIRDPLPDSPHETLEDGQDAPPLETEVHNSIAPANDADWLRSRTSRLLGLDDEDEGGARDQQSPEVDSVASQNPTGGARTLVVDEGNEGSLDTTADHSTIEFATPAEAEHKADVEVKIRGSKRLYLRNLAYNITEDDLRESFSEFGDLIEVHVPMDNRIGKPKGFAYLQFSDEDSAVHAWRGLDGKSLHGRLLHVLPASAKRETQLDDFALSKLPLKKQQQIKRRREASSTTFNWNSLYMNADAVMSSVSDRLGVSKSELLDPTSSDAAVKQAHAETHVIQETKSYFKSHGVDLDAFKRRERGDTAILVKNFPYDATISELKSLFEEHGKVKNFLMPPNGTIAIVEFVQAPQARTAFSALAYRKIKSSVLFLEKAPKDLFRPDHDAEKAGVDQPDSASAAAPSATELLQEDASQQAAASSTLFVRNLNFTTDSDRLSQVCKPLDGFLSARVKTKTDPKRPGEVLSMGFGFLEFKSKSQAQAALAAMDGYSLDGHKLQIRASHKGTDAVEERRQADQAKRQAAKGTKVVIKNLPFETSKKDIRSLFGSYGQLRSVRLPRKFDKSARGFAFADFTTAKEAENAIDALRDTHLLGRRLVLDFAAEDPEDAEAEIEKMQKKVGSQINKVALQKLTGSGRKKFNVGDHDNDEV